MGIGKDGDNSQLMKVFQSPAGILFVVAAFTWLTLVELTFAAAGTFFGSVFVSREYYGSFTVVMLSLQVAAFGTFYLLAATLFGVASSLVRQLKDAVSAEAGIQVHFDPRILEKLLRAFLILVLFWSLLLLTPIVMSIVNYQVRGPSGGGNF